MVELAQHWLPVVRIIVGGAFFVASYRFKDNGFQFYTILGISAAIIL